MRAEVLTARCRQSAGLYGLRAEERPNSWYVTWSFQVNEFTARKEKYESNFINGTILLDPGFPGCPLCGANSFVQCGSCGKLSCWMSGDQLWYCKWSPCREFGTPSGAIQSFTANGDR